MERKNYKRMMSLLLAVVMLGTLCPDLPMRKVLAASGEGVARVAEGEVGYMAVNYYDNKYGAEFGHNYTNWCAYFVAWCMKSAGVPSNVYNYHSSNLGYAVPNETVQSGYWHEGGYEPKAGDLLYVDFCNSCYYPEHIELITGYSGGTIRTASGNSSVGNGRGVIRREWNINDSRIKGICEVDYSGNAPAVPRPQWKGGNGGNGGGQSTYSANPDDNPMPTVTISTRSNARATGVAWIQAVLNRVNGNSLSVDGVFGSGTAAAVRDFQSKHGLAADSVVGPATRSALDGSWQSMKVVSATGISLSAASMDLTTGRTRGLSASVAPANASDQSVAWVSSDTGVATVSGGEVRAVKAGTATITASTHNGKTARCTVTVYDPYHIKFLNEDGSLLSEQKVGRGENANPPVNPEKMGYSFVRWDGTYQNVQSDATVTAVYKKNTYNVTFMETNGTRIGEIQKIPYQEAAKAPSEDALSIPEGYTFEGWSEPFDHVTSNLDIYPVYKWADEELPVAIVAGEDACQTEYDGSYSLGFQLKNHTAQERRARVMVYMTTGEGKMVAQGETRTVKIPAGRTDENGTVTEDGILDVEDMYIVCDEAADQARIIVLDEYESAVPLAEIRDIEIQAKGYGEWTDRVPEENSPEYAKRTMYHSKNVKYMTSTATNTIAGWTLYHTTAQYSGRGDRIYNGNGRDASAPGKDGAYRVWAEGISYPYDPSGYTVPTYNISVSTTGGDAYRSMVRWIQTCLCRYGFGTDIDGVFGYNTAAAVKNFQSANGLAADGIVGAGTRGCMQNKLNSDPLYNYYYESKLTTNTYYFYQVDSSWSDWTEEKIEGDKTLKTGTTKVLVESKEQYRYKIPETEKPESTIAMMKPECALPAEAMGLAGKDAVVIVFKNKVNQIAEDNVEYIGNTTIGADGSLKIAFVPREEPSYEGTGDYTVVLGVKGTTNYVKVGTVEAPKPVYNVTFVDEDGTEIDTQQIVEGHDAKVPESPEKKGYTFIGWDTGVTNIHGDLTVAARFRKDTYTVTYVDWENRKIEQNDCEYEEEITLPKDVSVPEGMVFTGWKLTDSEGTEMISMERTMAEMDAGQVDVDETKMHRVTSDLLCEAQFEPETFTVTFVDWEGKEVIREEVVYGKSAISPEVVEAGVIKSETVPETIEESVEVTSQQGEIKKATSTMNFVSWGEEVDLSCITSNLIVGAKYEYDQTVNIPVASVHTGEYDRAQDVALRCDTEDAVIYYTTDGSDPTDEANQETVQVYKEPIHISDRTKLRYYAARIGMNDSAAGEEWYVINEAGNVPTHIVSIIPVNVYDLAEIDGYRDFIQDGKLLDAEEMLTGEYDSVELQGIYYDMNFEERWQAGAQTITESLDLYAKYDAKQVNVTYLAEDGTEIATGTVSYGSAVDDSMAPKKAGFRFVGWESAGDPAHVVNSMTVRAKYIADDAYASVKFGRESYLVMEGSEFKLTPKLTYENSGKNASGEPLRYESSDTNAASVDNEGNVTAISKGTVTITVEVLSSGSRAECTLLITGNPESSICLYRNSVYEIEDGYLRNVPAGKNQVAAVRKQINAQKLRFRDRANIELSDEEMAGTGTRIQMLNEDGGLLDEVVAVITGDYNGDGVISGKDISGLTRSLLNKEKASEEQLRAMDLNGDGFVNNRDAAMLGRYLVGKEEL